MSSEIERTVAHDTADLDLACSILDNARHVVTDAPYYSKLRRRVEDVIFGSDPNRLIREWEQRKRAAADPTPTSVRVHERTVSERES